MTRGKLFRRDFTLVVIGQIISLLGNAVLRFVLPLYLLDITGSRSLFGLCSAAAFAPMVVLTPLGGAVGRTSCAMLALTDAGLAAALVEKLAQADPEAYGPAAEALRARADKQLQRQREQRAHEKKLERAGRKPWAPPPAGRAAPKNRGPGRKKKRTP